MRSPKRRLAASSFALTPARGIKPKHLGPRLPDITHNGVAKKLPMLPASSTRATWPTSRAPQAFTKSFTCSCAISHMSRQATTRTTGVSRNS